FLGCSSYPVCDYIRPIHQHSGKVLKALGIQCPKCESELVLRQGRYGMFIGCSNFPECDHISPSENTELIEKEAIKCPECFSGSVVERKSRFGKIFYSCDAYPKCRFSLNQKPSSGTCDVCNFSIGVIKKVGAETYWVCASRLCKHKQAIESRA
ncbi:topoisomerase DNA-binding C4 zinc finger domain-containing protein, partial [Vibrio sp.]|nr:topoisomerase DNA-binding C4 zinc finger domain-containing protein [Vibrio sp.]